MNTFFCADHSRQVGEDIIGSATNHQTYILVECPQPWLSEPFNSKWVPENLRVLEKQVKQSKLPVKFLLISNHISHKVGHTTLLIYDKKEGLGNGYRKQEFRLSNIEQVATVVSKWLKGGTTSRELQSDSTRDILVCTHGSHDMCCARYGNPFYHQATNIISDLGLDSVRVWKSSHFGGHRFAPTAIDLPEGRYYGMLDIESFKSILTRTGDIKCLDKVYRGWGILPIPIQVLERELMREVGWDWFNYKVRGRIIEPSTHTGMIQAELTIEKPDSSLLTFQAELLNYSTKNLQLKSSCYTKQEVVCTKYAVASLSLVEKKLVACAT